MKAGAAAIGVVFGIVLCWSGMTSPDVIRGALLFEESYLYLFMFSAMLTATVGQVLVNRGRAAVPRDKPQRRHVVGSVIFGVGWGISGACPGPIATQVGQGIWWSLFTLLGVVVGVYVFMSRSSIGETEPAVTG